MVARTIHLLNAAAKRCKKLTIRWVMAHQPGPEFVSNFNVDYLANEAAKNDTLPIAYDAPKIAYTTIKKIIRQKVDDQWERDWLAVEGHRQSKLFWPRLDKSRSHKLMLQNRTQWGRLIQFQTGHAHLNRHDFICYGAEDESYDPMCDFCDYNYLQTPAHLLSECAYFLMLRSDIFQEFIMDPPFLHPISKLNKFLSLSGLNDLLFIGSEVVQNTTT